MTTIRAMIYVFMAAIAVSCAPEAPEKAAAPPNPIERRVEPARDRVSEADSLMRVREREVRNLTGG